jgi:hypothetical protein
MKYCEKKLNKWRDKNVNWNHSSWF